METKHHYRNVLKSNHLSVPDLEDLEEKKQKLIFTIKHVRQEINVAVAGRRGDFNIVYFNEQIKPLVLNATNAKILRKLTNSPFVEDWTGLTIELYIDHAIMMKGEKTGGVRIMPKIPVLTKPELTVNHPRYEAAKKAWKEGKQEGVKKQFEVSVETIKTFEDGI